MYDIVTAALSGASIGLWFGHVMWKARLRDKIRYGIRLELDGRLYDIKSSESE